MSNILVTGASGFIGKNLLNQLKLDSTFNVLSFNRGDSMESLEESILKSDYIVHLAGEVRPNSTDEDFKNSNVFLSRAIIEILEKHNQSTPIIMASTIHAKLLKNEYGKTKREAELILKEYSLKHKVPCYIYRLPHVFGEGCKPNYNSVVTTWIFNSIKGLEINVFDRDIKMTYVYVQDIVNEFMKILKGDTPDTLYIEPSLTYNTTLGEVVDFIQEFQENILKENYRAEGSEFKEKLFNTYRDYYRRLNAK